MGMKHETAALKLLLFLLVMSASRALIVVTHRPFSQRVTNDPKNHHRKLQQFTTMGISRGNINNNNEKLNMEALELEQFKRRKEIVERKALQNQWRRPPNPFLGPVDLVSCLLEELRHPTSQFSGMTALLETSTESWRDMLRKSIGAPPDATNSQLAPPLEAALGRPNNQFAILMGVEDSNYQPSFPTDPLDYGDTCWVECRLRSGEDDELLVAMGWALEKRPSDGAWIVSAIDWQDFRDSYRPGIGREEWERICG